MILLRQKINSTEINLLAIYLTTNQAKLIPELFIKSTNNCVDACVLYFK